MIVLASKSPRRQQLLKQITEDFIIDVSDVIEKIPSNCKKQTVPIHLAKQKAVDVFKRHEDDIVIGADTIVLVNDEILGKPKDKDDVKRMITMLNDNTHEVITGVCIKTKEYCKTFKVVTKVTFKKMSEEEINDYCKLDSVYDKAGAYAIQEDAGKYIESIEGDYNNVVGFPVDELRKYLK